MLEVALVILNILTLTDNNTGKVQISYPDQRDQVKVVGEKPDDDQTLINLVNSLKRRGVSLQANFEEAKDWL